MKIKARNFRELNRVRKFKIRDSKFKILNPKSWISNPEFWIDREKIMEDKELKKKLDKIPDVDENGDPIYKIDLGLGGKPDAPKKPEKKWWMRNAEYF